MKKNLLFAAMVAFILCFTFTSCDKDEQTPAKTEQEQPEKPEQPENPENPDNPDNPDEPNPPTETYRLIEDFENGGILTWKGNVNKNSNVEFSIVENPSKTGDNTSDMVGKFVAGGLKWDMAYSSHFGVKEEEDTPDCLEFSKDGYIFKVDVYVPKMNVPVNFKMDGFTVDEVTYPAVEITETVATTEEDVNKWITVSFDFTNGDKKGNTVVDGIYRNAIIMFDAGVVTSGGDIFYFDNIRLCKE